MISGPLLVAGQESALRRPDRAVEIIERGQGCDPACGVRYGSRHCRRHRSQQKWSDRPMKVERSVSADEAGRHLLARRTVNKAAVWAMPVIALAAAAPASAASNGSQVNLWS